MSGTNLLAGYLGRCAGNYYDSNREKKRCLLAYCFNRKALVEGAERGGVHWENRVEFPEEWAFDEGQGAEL